MKAYLAFSIIGEYGIWIVKDTSYAKYYLRLVEVDIPDDTLFRDNPSNPTRCIQWVDGTTYEDNPNPYMVPSKDIPPKIREILAYHLL